MISHIEAQALISAQLDGPLDIFAERELAAHLVSCSRCRAFAQSSETLAQGLRELPYLPASPTVTRAVLEHIDAGRSPWSRLGGVINANPGPALSTVAAIALLIALGALVYSRFLVNDAEPGDSQLLSAITREADQATQPPTDQALVIAAAATSGVVPSPTPTETPSPTATQAPTSAPSSAASQLAPETPSPTATTEPTVTLELTPEPTATEEPTVAPTSTSEPTETPAPTATLEPTATTQPGPEPTATAAPTTAPTATTEPTPEPTATQEPTQDPGNAEIVDLTQTEAATREPAPTSAVTATPDSTQAPEPTATVTPEPTATPSPEPTVTPEPTAAPTEDQGPPIEPLDGTYAADESGQAQTGPAEATEATQAPTETPATVGIESMDEPQQDERSGDRGQDRPTEGAGGTDGVIQPIEGGASLPAEVASEPAATQTPGPEGEQPGTDLASVSTSIGGVGGSGARLGLSADNTLVRADEPSAAPATGASGLEMGQVGAENGQAVAVCDGNGNCTDVSSASRAGKPAEDTPLGWLGDGLVYQRMAGNAVSYRYVDVDPDTGEAISDTELLAEDAAFASAGPAYAGGSTMLIPTARGDWVVLTPDGGRVARGQGGTPSLVRVSGESFSAPFPYVSYVTGGKLVIANLASPGDAVVEIPFAGVDYDVSPDVTQVVVNTGQALEIYSTEGALRQAYDAGAIEIGGVLWLRDGIVYEDRRSGDVFLIDGTGQR